MLTEEFDYELPGELIAQIPIEPRDSARLLDATDLSDHWFTELPSLLREGDLLIVNRTRVRPARLIGVKEPTGGSVELLLLKRLDGDRWDALVRPARRLRKGARMRFGEMAARLESDPVDGKAVVVLETKTEVEESLRQFGEIPLPPYIHADLADPERYQTMWADVPGSAAAPTAGLHFTPGLVDELVARGIEFSSVDLEVGLATFRPISTRRVEDHQMHFETIRVDEAVTAAVDRARERRGRVVAVGTTSVRALEACAAGGGRIRPFTGETSLFMHPGCRFTVADGLVTNFHMPRSSLIVMIAGFMGADWRRAYEVAIARRYRFLSFGDAMYCERV